MTSKGVRPAAVTLLSDGELDTLALRQRDPWLLLSDDASRSLVIAPQTTGTSSNLHDVGLTSGELVVNSVLDVDNVEASVVALTVGDDTNTTHVTTTSGHGDHTSVEADEVLDLACKNVSVRSPEFHRISSCNIPVVRLILTVSLTLMAGSG